MVHFRRSPDRDEPLTDLVDQELLRRGIRFNAIVLALVMGLFGGFGLFLLTHLSLLITGENAGRYLNLLGVFFPGYRATPTGAWVDRDAPDLCLPSRTPIAGHTLHPGGAPRVTCPEP